MNKFFTKILYTYKIFNCILLYITCLSTQYKVLINLRNFFIIECGLTEGISNRIIGGKVSIPHIFPWVVAILNKNNFHCGGTLINNQYILTAGHCVQWYLFFLKVKNTFNIILFLKRLYMILKSMTDNE